MDFKHIIEAAGEFLDGAGVLVIVVGVLSSTVGAAIRWLRGDRSEVYSRFRSQLGRSILLGLELLVGADIVRTVAVTPTLASVLALGLVVLIRTFLSFSLELEITGRWPWHKGPGEPAVAAKPPSASLGRTSQG
ncbi:MAG TPA: DUF1622 domain-containing protein [Propionibacteriaceae bacterium]|nr:DUF1622 domain-containing protein [Propionibacteriaceae bacterium]